MRKQSGALGEGIVALDLVRAVGNPEMTETTRVVP